MIEIFETIDLIVDSKDRNFDKEAFAKELGMNCDSVGWMRLDIRKDIDKLKQISGLAKTRDLKLRGTYRKKSVDASAKWYRFSPKNDFAMSDYSYVQRLGNYSYYKIKAYKAPKRCNIMGGFVSQTFVDSYKELKLTGLDFIWVPDNGKYQAVSFYNPIFLKRAERCIYPGQMSYLEKEIYDIGTLAPIVDKYDFSVVNAYYKQADFPEGRLCEVEKYMDNMNVVLPFAVEYDSMPDTDFAYCVLNGYIPIFLIRDEALQKMINAGVVTKDDFEPVLCTDSKEQNLLVQKCDEYKNINVMLENKEYFEKLRNELASKERPEFVPSEKEVLALLKKYKKRYGEYLNRAIPKSLSEKVEKSPYSPLLPYYKVADGGRLAEDTYEYYHYETAVQKNDIFHKELSNSKKQEEHINLLNDAVLFGRSGDDNYLLLYMEQVYEVSCYDYELVKHWDYVYLFFYENVMG